MKKYILVISIFLSSAYTVAMDVSQVEGGISVITGAHQKKEMKLQIQGSAAMEIYKNLEVQEQESEAFPTTVKEKRGRNTICYLYNDGKTLCTLDINFFGTAVTK